MRCYLFNNARVTVLAEVPASVLAGSDLVRSVKELDQNRFPLARLVDIWNTLPSVEPLKRFRDREVALKRIWTALEARPVSSARADSKQAVLIELLSRPSGAELEELITATGWQAHSVRGALSGVLRKKLGLNVVSVKDGNTRSYRIQS